MLTLGPTADTKYELNIISFLTLTSTSITLPHLCLEYHGHCMLLQVMGDRKVGRWFIYVRIWVGGQGAGIIFFLLFVLYLCCC